MAWGTAIREPSIKPPIKEVVLHLTEEEAVAIAAAAGGSPGGTTFSPIYRALYDLGLGYGHSRYEEFYEIVHSTIAI